MGIAYCPCFPRGFAAPVTCLGVSGRGRLAAPIFPHFTLACRLDARGHRGNDANHRSDAGIAEARLTPESVVFTQRNRRFRAVLRDGIL